MSDTLRRVIALSVVGKVNASRHGYLEMAKDDIYFDELVAGIARAVVVEDYPKYAKGPCVLVLQYDAAARPVHALWGIESGRNEPAALITAYRPDESKWDTTFLKRVR